jgi:hypothetical protein
MPALEDFSVRWRIVSSTLAGVFGIAALFVAVLALVFAIQALRAQRGPATRTQPPEPEPQLELSAPGYDAYGEMSGRLSWSMALVNDNGNGVVLTSINSRNDARSYAKEVKGFASESKLSPEEAEAIETLRVKASLPLGDPDQQ